MSLTDPVDETELDLKLRKLRMCLEENPMDVDSRVEQFEQTIPTVAAHKSGVQISPLYKDRSNDSEEEGKVRQLFRKWSNQWMTYWYPQGASSLPATPILSNTARYLVPESNFAISNHLFLDTTYVHKVADSRSAQQNNPTEKVASFDR